MTPGSTTSQNGTPVRTTLAVARRLFVIKQRLSGPLPKRAGKADIVSIPRDLCYVQWDPVSVVAPGHILTLWSRLGNFRRTDLDSLLADERKLFRYCVHADSIVATEEFPLFRSYMARYPESLSDSWGNWRAHTRQWLPRHADLRRRVLGELKDGPLSLNEFKDHVRTRRDSGGWSSGSDVSAMLFHLWMSGEVMLVGRQGSQNVWGLSASHLPKWVDRRALTSDEAERQAAERAIRALGFASRREITLYFVRGMYLNLDKALDSLLKDSVIRPVEIEGLRGRETRYIHCEDVSLLESLGDAPWEPRLSLISPFDSLICLRDRGRDLFGFNYFLEMYVPKLKRKFGYYVLPILWGDQFIGRLDPKFDRETSTLRINSVHAEPGAPKSKEVSSAFATTVERLADFLGAESVAYSRRIPTEWKRSLR
jgi:uncharacterized protein